MRKLSAKVAVAALAIGSLMGLGVVAAPAAQASDTYVKYFYGISIWDASGQCTSWVNSRQIEVVSSCSLWSLGDTVVFRVTYKLARNSGH